MKKKVLFFCTYSYNGGYGDMRKVFIESDEIDTIIEFDNWIRVVLNEIRDKYNIQNVVLTNCNIIR